jgi:hypothetical protein
MNITDGIGHHMSSGSMHLISAIVNDMVSRTVELYASSLAVTMTEERAMEKALNDLLPDLNSACMDVVPQDVRDLLRTSIRYDHDTQEIFVSIQWAATVPKIVMRLQ